MKFEVCLRQVVVRMREDDIYLTITFKIIIIFVPLPANSSMRLTVLLIVFCSLPFLGRAQNLFPNPGFELYDQCPDYTSQINRCTDWDSAIGTADFYHCGYYAPSTIGSYGTPRTGSGVIGLVCGPPSVFNPSAQWYGETFQGLLKQTLVAGATYKVISHWRATDMMLPPAVSGCYSIGFYFFKSIHPPQAPITGCSALQPQVIIDPGVVPVNAYGEFNIDFIADSCYDAVMIGLFCNDSTTSQNCLQTSDYEYFDVDDISLTKIADAPVTSTGFDASERIICEGDCINFNDRSSANRYRWKWEFEGAVTGSSNDTNPAAICYTSAGSYDVTLITTFECGQDTLTKNDYITVNAVPVLEIIADTVPLCYGESKVLHAESNSSVVWSTGSIGKDLQIQFPGTYIATSSNGCGTAADTIGIAYENCPCTVWLPNAFTPNNDGKNDDYAAVSECVIEQFSMNIFNRWGQLVYKTNDNAGFWNGQYQQADAPEGLYIVRLNFKGYDSGRSEKKELTQTFSLIR